MTNRQSHDLAMILMTLRGCVPQHTGKISVLPIQDRFGNERPNLGYVIDREYKIDKKAYEQALKDVTL